MKILGVKFNDEQANIEANRKPNDTQIFSYMTKT